MAADNKSTPLRVDAGIGIFWFIGWLFTIAFANYFEGKSLPDDVQIARHLNRA